MEIEKSQVDKVNNHLKAEEVLQEIGYRIETIHQQGDNIRCFCPIHKETIFRSLIIDVIHNTYKCGYTLCEGFNGNNLLDLYSRCKGIPLDESVLYWAKKRNVTL